MFTLSIEYVSPKDLKPALRAMLSQLELQPDALDGDSPVKEDGPAIPALETEILKAITIRPLNNVEQHVTAILFANPADEWLPYKEILQRLEQEYGISNQRPGGLDGPASPADYKAARALGLLSGRIKECVPNAEWKEMAKPIEVLASRTKILEKGMCYKLTTEGRAALSKVLKT